jgi:hypothetical protein
MARSVFPWVLAGGAAAAIIYAGARSTARRAAADRTRSSELPNPELRNASLNYRPIGAPGDRYPAWVRALRGKSGVYLIRERQRDGTNPVAYIGESHAGRLYQTLTRHFQTWRRHKKFWSGQYTGSQSHDPGLTYNRGRCTVAVRVLSPERAMAEEARLIARLRPRDNLLYQPDVEPIDDEVVPF